MPYSVLQCIYHLEIVLAICYVLFFGTSYVLLLDNIKRSDFAVMREPIGKFQLKLRSASLEQ